MFETLDKCDQMAIYVHNRKQADAIKQLMGLTQKEWILDNPTGKARTANWHGELTAHLQFNNDLMTDVELELISCEGHDHAYTLYAEWDLGLPFIAHLGFHVKDEFPDMGDAPLVQEMWTERHTNLFLINNGRRYHYRVYDTRPQLGTFTKLIKRIERASA